MFVAHGERRAADRRLSEPAGPALHDLDRSVRSIAKGAGGPEVIHRLRAACRRLQTLLEYAPLPRTGRVERVRRAVRRLKRRAGRVRDSDVSLDLLGRLAGAGVGRLQRRTEKVRERSMDRLRAAARRRGARELGGRVRRLLPEVTPAAASRAVAAARAEARRRAEKAGAGERGRPHPSRLHALRLALKRVRDLAEMLGPALPRGAEQLARRADAIARRLGAVQDLCVLSLLAAGPGGSASLARETASRRDRALGRAWPTVRRAAALCAATARASASRPSRRRPGGA